MCAMYLDPSKIVDNKRLVATPSQMSWLKQILVSPELSQEGVALGVSRPLVDHTLGVKGSEKSSVLSH